MAVGGAPDPLVVRMVHGEPYKLPHFWMLRQARRFWKASTDDGIVWRQHHSLASHCPSEFAPHPGYKWLAAAPTLNLGIGSGGPGGGGTGGSSSGGGHGDGSWSPQDPQPQYLLAEAGDDDKQSSRKPGPPIVLTLCSFAVTRMAYSQITRKFRQYYKEKTGREVRFRLSFAGSGVQARAVIDGLPADIVALALPLDVLKIVEAGLIHKDWRNRAPNGATACESVVAIVTRRGNPKNIHDWSDLVRNDVSVVTANPKTAGVARWTFLALWGNVMGRGDSKAKAWLTDFFRHVPVQPRDAREASEVFYKQKVGDALLTYENEVYMTNQMVGEEDALPYSAPTYNIRIEAPVAIVDRNINLRPPEVREAAEAFVNFLFTPEAQREFVRCGFRSIIPSVADETPDRYPPIKTKWTVDKKIGGWYQAQSKFFNPGKILDDIQKQVGEEKLAERRNKGKS
ncbi:unnamed protein product [Ostreobium quekettii]|uniref:Sulfate-binding protein n=1 Tax=Ostreobium quekettii TaxID=121088 RepID=A0A8S1J6Z6_9CHLO|nr:unnamed protein product [Ostreobium quekettii]